MMRKVALWAVLAALASSCSGNGAPAADGELGERTVESGEVTVTVRPARIEDTVAVFEVTFDTHAVELDVDLAAASSLEVGGTPWTGARWTGDPPGGHHREGRLEFSAAGRPAGRAVLRISGLPEPVEMSWSLD